jgi:GH24 family phage-related lysozyme (muramidase)
MAADDAAVTVTLRANLKDYEAALKSAVRATERAAKAAESAISNVGKGQTSNVIAVNFQKSAGQIANDARVLQFQLNDIFSGIASGQGIRAVQQQLGQIAQQMSGGSLAAGARTLGAAMVGMINPINLAVVAFGVLASVAASYFSDSEKDAAAATKELEKQGAELDKLAEKYGGLFPELKRAADNLRAQADAAGKAAAMQTALAAAYDDTRKTLEKIGPSLGTMGAGVQEIFDLTAAFAKLDKAVKSNNASSKDAQQLLMVLNGIIANGSPQVVKLATAIRDNLVTSFEELDRAAKSAGETIQNSLDFQMPGAGGPLDLTPLQRAQAGATLKGDAAQFIRKEEGFRAKAYWDVNAWRIGFGSDTFVDAMGEVQRVTKDTVVTLQQANQDLARRIPEFQKTITDAIGPDYWNSLNEAQQAALTSIAYNYGSLPKSIVKAIQAGDQGQVAKAIAGLSANPERRAREAAAFGGAPKATTQETALKNLADWNVETERRIELEKQVADINAQFWESEAQRGAQIEALRIAEEQLNELRKAGVTVTAEQEAQIRKLAQAQAEVTLKSEQAKEALAQSNIAQKQMAAELQQINQQMAGIIGGALSSFVQDLMAGKDAGEAFSGMLKRMAAQIADMAIQMLIIKPLMNSLFGGVGGVGGLGAGLFEGGGTVGMSGRRDGRNFSPALWAGAPRYAKGGMVGLRPGEVPIIAHKGEIVVPNARRLAGRGPGQSDTVNVRLHDDSGRMAEIADQRIQTASGTIVKVSVVQSAKTIQKQLPGMMANAQVRTG